MGSGLKTRFKQVLQQIVTPMNYRSRLYPADMPTHYIYITFNNTDDWYSCIAGWTVFDFFFLRISYSIISEWILLRFKLPDTNFSRSTTFVLTTFCESWHLLTISIFQVEGGERPSVGGNNACLWVISEILWNNTVKLTCLPIGMPGARIWNITFLFNQLEFPVRTDKTEGPIQGTDLRTDGWTDIPSYEVASKRLEIKY